MNRRAIAWIAAGALACGPAIADPDLHAGGDLDRSSPGGRELLALPVEPLSWSIPRVGREVERVEIPGGTVVFLYPDDSRATCTIAVTARGGSAYEPPGKAGESALAAAVLRDGGTVACPGERLEAVLDEKGLSLSVEAQAERVTVSLSGLSRLVDPQALEIVRDLCRDPAYPADRFEGERGRMIDGIRRRDDNPTGLARRLFPALLYGEHPYGRFATRATVTGISRDDLVAWHRRTFHPSRLWIAASGRFDRARILGWAADSFSPVPSPWPWETGPAPILAPASESGNVGVFLVRRPITQSRIFLGHLGVDFYHPDVDALRLMNDVLGGGTFTSRIGMRVREDEGLAYSVGSQFNPRADRGTFGVVSLTRADGTVHACRIILEEIERMRREGPTETELRTAREMALHQYVFAYEDPATAADALLMLEFNDRPRDRLERYPEAVAALTRDDVARAAAAHLDPSRLTLLVVGDPDRFDAPLSSLGMGEPKDLPAGFF